MNIRSSGKWINLIRFPGFCLIVNEYETNRKHHIYLLPFIFVSRAIAAIQPSSVLFRVTKAHTIPCSWSLSAKITTEIFIGARQTWRKLPFYARASVERIELIASILERDEVHVFLLYIVCYFALIRLSVCSCDFTSWRVNKILQPNKSHSSLSDNDFRPVALPENEIKLHCFF